MRKKDEKAQLFILECIKDGIDLAGTYIIMKQRQRIKEAVLTLIVVVICCIITVSLLLY